MRIDTVWCPEAGRDQPFQWRPTATLVVGAAEV
jgi:hypothetical protein